MEKIVLTFRQGGQVEPPSTPGDKELRSAAEGNKVANMGLQRAPNPAALRSRGEIKGLRYAPMNGCAAHVVSLAKGTHLEICGIGFNDRTIKAHIAGRFFFVFLQDLGLIEPIAVNTT